MNDGDHFGAQIAERMRADAAEPPPDHLMEQTMSRIAVAPQRGDQWFRRAATKLVAAGVLLAAVVVGAQLGGLIGRPVATGPSPSASVQAVATFGPRSMAPTASVSPSASVAPSAPASTSSPSESHRFQPWAPAVVELPARNTSVMNAAILGGNGYVGVGGGGSIEGLGGVLAWHSPDGQTWALTLDGHRARDGSRMVDVAATETGYVGVGDNASGTPVWVSADGITWSEADDPSAPDGASDALRAISGSENNLVGIGFHSEDDQQSATVWSSSDGRAWARLEVPDDYAGAWPVDIAVGDDGRAVIVGMTAAGQGDAVAWVVDDGLIQERVALPSEDSEAMVSTVVATPSGFTAVGSGWDQAGSAYKLLAWLSTDGLTWELTDADATGSPLGASHIDGRGVVAVGATMGIEESEVTAWELSDGGAARTILVDRSNGAGLAVLVDANGRLMIVGADDPDGAATVWIEP